MERVVFKTNPCLTPWNSSACSPGYYTKSGLDILPCPPGRCLYDMHNVNLRASEDNILFHAPVTLMNFAIPPCNPRPNEGERVSFTISDSDWPELCNLY